MGEENENDVGQEEAEEEIFTVENPNIDLEVIMIQFSNMDYLKGSYDSEQAENKGKSGY